MVVLLCELQKVSNSREADVSQEVLVDFGEEIRQAQPCVQDEIKARLMPMKCEYTLKSRIYGLCRGGSKEQTICDILTMDISEELKYAVLEPVLRIV
ncbi:MAG: hypothetical protein PUF72_01580 [Clostridiales bacterium]|nr:hypothetical protein [Clostridiales bacterium]